MASELRVDTLKDSSGNNSVGMAYVSNGSAKAWANLNGTGTIALRDSFNSSATTDNGSGDYTFNLTSSMSDGDYGFTTSGCAGNNSSSLVVLVKSASQYGTPSNQASGACQVTCHNYVNTATDTGAVYPIFHGDLA